MERPEPHHVVTTVPTCPPESPGIDPRHGELTETSSARWHGRVWLFPSVRESAPIVRLNRNSGEIGAMDTPTASVVIGKVAWNEDPGGGPDPHLRPAAHPRDC